MTEQEELLRKKINQRLRELEFNEDNRLGVLTLFDSDIDRLQTFIEYLCTTELTRDDRGEIYLKAREITGKKYMRVIVADD